MKLKTLVATAAVGLGAFASSAFAQFDGVYVGGGLGMFKGTFEVNAIAPGVGTGTFGSAKTKAGLDFSVGYGASFDRWNMAGELSYNTNLGDSTSSSFLGPVGTSADFNLKKAWTLSFLPGYKVSNDLLAFARIGYAQATLGGSAVETAGAAFGTVSAPGSQKHTGTVWGLGTKIAMNKNLSVVGEFQFYDFKSKNYTDNTGVGVSVKPASTGLHLGVQYTF